MDQDWPRMHQDRPFIGSTVSSFYCFISFIYFCIIYKWRLLLGDMLSIIVSRTLNSVWPSLTFGPPQKMELSFQLGDWDYCDWLVNRDQGLGWSADHPRGLAIDMVDCKNQARTSVIVKIWSSNWKCTSDVKHSENEREGCGGETEREIYRERESRGEREWEKERAVWWQKRGQQVRGRQRGRKSAGGRGRDRQRNR